MPGHLLPVFVLTVCIGDTSPNIARMLAGNKVQMFFRSDNVETMQTWMLLVQASWLCIFPCLWTGIPLALAEVISQCQDDTGMAVGPCNLFSQAQNKLSFQ